MAGRKVFAGSPVGVVSVVEASLSQTYARKARVAFLTVGAGSAMATATLLSVFAHPVLGVLIGVVAGLMLGFVTAALVRVWPVLRVLWWWSAELLVGAVTLLVPSVTARLTHPWVALLELAATAGAGAGIGPVRRRLAAWSWCLAVRHRLRLCFAEFLRAVTRSNMGRLPLILWAKSTPAGARVWVWLRPGLDLADLDGKTGRIAVACWASEARVVRASEKFAALIRVDLIRRDPLAKTVESVLAALIPRRKDDDKQDAGSNAPVSPALSPVGLDLADIPEPPPDTPRGGRR
jgi:hypothetical protein